jgi:hypothetical protein
MISQLPVATVVTGVAMAVVVVTSVIAVVIVVAAVHVYRRARRRDDRARHSYGREQGE